MRFSALLGPDGSMPRPVVIATTLVIGTAVLGATLAVSSGSVAFYALGIVLAATWIVGAACAGPFRWSAQERGIDLRIDVGLPIALGAAVFGGFVIAKLLADQIPFLADNVADVLARAHAGRSGVVLVVALFNGLAEEVFFRGVVQSAFAARFGPGRAVWWATLVYAAVTVATLNPALVVAALVLGAILALERRLVGGVLGPVLTHVIWSTLIILFLPR